MDVLVKPTPAEKLAALQRLRERLLAAVKDGGRANPEALTQIEREIAKLERETNPFRAP